MIEAVEKRAGILIRVKDGVVNLLRGYSEEDVASARRIINGCITSADRARFINDEVSRLSALYFSSFTRSVPPDFNPPDYFLKRSSFEEEITKLQTLSGEEMDPKIRYSAQQRLKQWGKL